jgi:mevalonate pyrophosphate decarboxylase
MQVLNNNNNSSSSSSSSAAAAAAAEAALSQPDTPNLLDPEQTANLQAKILPVI